MKKSILAIIFIIIMTFSLCLVACNTDKVDNDDKNDIPSQQQPEKPACVHDYAWSVEKQVSCVVDGLEKFKCKLCGDVMSERPIKAPGHQPGADGKCTVCHSEISYALNIDTNSDSNKILVTPQKDKYLHGETVTLKIFSDEAFVIKSFSVNDVDTKETLLGNKISIGYQYSFKITSDTKISVMYDIIVPTYTFDLSSIDTQCGKVTISPKKDEYEEKEVVTIRVDNFVGYDITDFTVAGEDHWQDMMVNELEYEVKLGDDLVESKDERVVKVTCGFKAVNYNEVTDVDFVNFYSIIKNGMVLIDFYTDWCVNCPAVAQAFKTLVEQDTGARFCRINADSRKADGTVEKENYRRVMVKYNLSGWPNVGMWIDGVYKGCKTGAAGASTYSYWINQMKKAN